MRRAQLHGRSGAAGASGSRGTALPSLGLGTSPLRAARALGGPEARCRPRGWERHLPAGQRGRRVWQPAMESFRLRASECVRAGDPLRHLQILPGRPTGRGPSSAVGCARGRRGLSAPRAGRRCRGTPPRRRRREKRKSPLELHQMQILCVLRKEKRKEGEMERRGFA